MSARLNFVLGLVLALLPCCRTAAEQEATKSQIATGDWMSAKAEIYRELAVRSLRGGDPDRTRKLLAEALQFEEGDVRSIQVLARLSLTSGDLVEAKSYTQWWLRLEPDSIPALCLAGIIEESLGHTAEAETYFLRARDLDKADPRPLIDLHTFYLNRGREKEAAVVRADLRRRFPQSHEVLLDHGAYLESRGQWGEALESLQEARCMRPDDLDLAARVGTAALLDDRDEVLGELDRGLPPHARLADASLALILSAARLRAGDEEGVLQELELLEGPARRDPVICLLRGEILIGRKDLTGAEAAFREALAQDERLARAHGGLGRVHLLRGQPDAARRALRRAVELAPRGAENRALLAACMAQVCDFDNAYEQLAVARESGGAARLVAEVELRYPQLAAIAPAPRRGSASEDSDDGK
jgi:tetratricopeptide (TPR) repeat protein